tara:strand:+ start:396 stop:1217 length:822 start_codon:yes stop_codon:yes gene_type:complete
MEVAKSKSPGFGVRALFGGRKKRKAGEKGKAEYTGETPGFEDREAAEMRLAMTAANIQNNFVVDEDSGPGQSMRFLDESDPRSGAFIEDVLLTDTYGAGGEDARSTSTAWSAATTSAHVRGFLGANSNQEAKEMGFRPYGAHRLYMNDAFKTKSLKKDETYEYDAYEAKRLIGKTVDELRAGDLLFRGYNDSNSDADFRNTQDWKFGQFKRSGEKGEKYTSHTDIIVATGVDQQGRKYYDIAGGNVRGKEYMLERIYPEEIRDTYKGAMISKK